MSSNGLTMTAVPVNIARERPLTTRGTTQKRPGQAPTDEIFQSSTTCIDTVAFLVVGCRSGASLRRHISGSMYILQLKSRAR